MIARVRVCVCMCVCVCVCVRRLRVNFTRFSTEACCDRFTVLNANGSALLGLTGEHTGEVYSFPLAATAQSCIWFNFVSDSSVTSTGVALRYNVTSVAAPSGE